MPEDRNKYGAREATEQLIWTYGCRQFQPMLNGIGVKFPFLSYRASAAASQPTHNCRYCVGTAESRECSMDLLKKV